jgi:hypothetical protein
MLVTRRCLKVSCNFGYIADEGESPYAGSGNLIRHVRTFIPVKIVPRGFRSNAEEHTIGEMKPGKVIRHLLKISNLSLI